MYDVITMGSNTVDLFVNTGLHEIKKRRKGLIAYPVGSKILIKKTLYSTGGGGTNTAVSFSRIGLKTGYLGKIGNEEFGKRIKEMLKKEKIAFLGTQGKGVNNYSVILDSKEHNRTILTYKGLSDTLKFKEINIKKLKTKWFYFSSMLRDSLKTQKKLAKLAEKKNIKIAFNPSSYQTKLGKKHIEPILKRTEILILNDQEAKMLVKGDLLKELYKLGPKIVCITYGKKGAELYDGEFKYMLSAHKSKVKERTGAGDAFASGLVAGIIKGKDIETSMQIGLANAESVIKHYGAKNKLLSWKQAANYIKKYPAKINKKKY